LSRSSDAEVRDTYAEYDWPRRTDVTITSPEELLAVLAEVRARGCAVEFGTTTSGIECVAAPVLTGGGAAVAALGIARVAGTGGPDLEALGADVRAAARSFSEALGHVGAG
jgi:IclR family acetate operon transcriptional repressor